MKDTDIELVEEGTDLYLYAPFHASARRSYRNIDGQWEPDRKAWRFNPRDRDRVRKALNRHFGYDDRPVEVVDVRVVGQKVFDEDDQHWYFGGRTVASRRYRDADVQLGDGVLLLEGRFSGSGGSMKYPDIGTNEVVLEIRDVPKHHEDLQQDGVTVIEQENINPDVKRAELLEEKQQLLARIAEIDTTLKGL